MVHDIKCWPQYFCRVKDGSKTFEVRVNDRGYQPGDRILLREWNPKIEKFDNGYDWDERPKGYTGDQLDFIVGYVLPIDESRVVFSLLPVIT